jgi:predicted GH43/DUF377 family glycosyl hydrolase
MSGFQLQRLGVVMEPQPGNEQEVEGVLNPAAVRAPDGLLYLFPRLVARGNYSRIGIARVRFNEAGDPAGVERLGIALETEADYERRPDGGGGCEDPRITFVEPLQRYMMTYTAFSPEGPRIALALSEDLFHWKRLGLATFYPYHGVNEVAEPGDDGRHLCYSAGVMVLSKEHPREIRYRSVKPVLTPELPQERHGTIANVVFPTGIDRRDDLGSPDRFDVYYGMADYRIGVARLDVPERLSSELKA